MIESECRSPLRPPTVALSVPSRRIVVGCDQSDPLPFASAAPRSRSRRLFAALTPLRNGQVARDAPGDEQHEQRSSDASTSSFHDRRPTGARAPPPLPSGAALRLGGAGAGAADAPSPGPPEPCP